MKHVVTLKELTKALKKNKRIKLVMRSRETGEIVRERIITKHGAAKVRYNLGVYDYENGVRHPIKTKFSRYSQCCFRIYLNKKYGAKDISSIKDRAVAILKAMRRHDLSSMYSDLYISAVFARRKRIY